MPQKFSDLVIPEDHDGRRLDRVLAQLLPELSRSRIKQLIEAGQVSLGGQPCRNAAMKARHGQIYDIIVPDPRPATPEGQAMALEILYEDGDIVVLMKPAGLVVHPGAGNPDRTLVNALIAHCGDSLKGIGGELRPGIVHRLDKDTSGVMVAAKSEAAHRDLVRQFSERSIERRYHALVWGAPRPRRGELTGNIGRSPRNRKKMAVLSRGGRPAITRYELLASYGGGLASLVECRLLTGRTHQIRVHMSDSGHPLLGDPLYGRERQARTKALDDPARGALQRLGRQALHAKTLAFRHPINGGCLEFDTKLPNDIKALINCLEAL